MHDVVAHSMSVIAVQAAAGREIVHDNPDKAAEVFARIETVGRESLAELRRMLGVLRGADGGGAALSPQPGIADIAAAVAQSSAGGVRAELVIDGHERPLPPGIELAAYRIVQEALTNVRKHAGRTASATVRISYERHTLGVEVTDDGRGAATSLSRTGSGQGLIGMRERVEIYGGEFTSGPDRAAATPYAPCCPSRTATAGGRQPSSNERPDREEAGRPMTIRVAIVDDQALMRDGFSMILEAQADIDVVGDAENGRHGVELCRRTRPDVALMDIRMPVMDGIEATRLITSDNDYETKVLVLTTFDLDEYVYAALPPAPAAIS